MSDEERAISTEGGTYIEGQAQTDGGDFIGRDKIVHETHYHYVDRPGPDVPYLTPSLPPHHVPREAELATLRALLLGQERDIAVTALRGMGGVGKTTLAIALCHDEQIIEAFPDGILWTTLGPQADLLSTQATWGGAFGVDLSNLPDVEARTARLRSLLHSKRCLLVIDDVWDAAHLSPMQVDGPQCATLVTTRERKIAQKVGAAHDLDVLEPAQALALLAQWAGEIAESERVVAGELAKRLGYLPLALALAGAQTQDGESWDDLLAAFRNAQGADVTLLDLDDPTIRDESLALTFDLSLKKLGDALPEQFAMLGVFAAGREAPFTVEAAAAVWDMKPIKAKKLLGRLIRAALLNKEEHEYSLHLLLGDYARSQMTEAMWQTAQARHFGHYLQIAQRSKQEWQVAERAIPQMRIAWSRIDRDDVESLYSWIVATQMFCKLRGRWNDQITWVKAALTATISHKQRKRERWCRGVLGDAYIGLNMPDEALKQGQVGLAIARELGDRYEEAQALNLMGRSQGGRDLAKKLEAHQAALAIGRELGHQGIEAWELNNIAGVYYHQGEFAKAMEYFQVSLAIMRAFGDQRGEANVLRHIADIYLQHNELAEALANYENSLSLQTQIGNRSDEAWSHNGIGRVYVRQGKLDEGLNQFQACLTIYREIDNQLGEAIALHNMGFVFRQRGELTKALTKFQASMAILRQLGNKRWMALSHWNTGLTYQQMGQLAEAEKSLVEALALFQAMEMLEAVEVRQNLARVRDQLLKREDL